MFSCLGCLKNFDNPRALRGHGLFCMKKGGGASLADMLQKRLAEEEARKKVKRQKLAEEAAARERKAMEAAQVCVFSGCICAYMLTPLEKGSRATIPTPSAIPATIT